jgi:predicted nucleic acid-binding protein
MREALIINASPLIFLGNAGRLDLLHALEVRRYLVPEPVWTEVTGSQHADVAALALAATAFIERVPAAAVPATLAAWDLGPGETAVIATALATMGSAVLLDDLAGRRAARAHGLPVFGTLGLVLRAERCDLIPDARAVILALRDHGMWLSDAAIEAALQTRER